MGFLLLIPKDPKNDILFGFSLPRLLMLVFLLVGSFFCGWIAVHKAASLAWIPRLFESALENKKAIPYSFLVLSLTGLSVLTGILLYAPDILQNLTVAHFVRLSPVLLWIGLAGCQLGILWVTRWGLPRVHIPAATCDAAFLLVLYCVSFFSRLGLTGYMLPYQSVWDEVVTYPQALQMLVEPGLKTVTDVPGYGNSTYGDLLVYITAGSQVLGLMNGLRTQQVSSVEAFVAAPEGAASVNSAVSASGIPLQYPRMVLAAINSLTPLLIYWALRRYLKANRWSAFCASLFYAILSRDVLYYTSFILPDGLATTLFTLALLAALHTIQDDEGRFRPLLLTGFLCGTVLSVAIRDVAVVLVPFLAFLLAKNHSRSLEKLLGAVASLLVGFFATSPYALLDLPNQLHKWTGLSWYHEMDLNHRIASLNYYLSGMFKPGFDGTYVDTNSGTVGLGLLAGILAVIGLGWLILHFPREAGLLAAFFALHLYTITPVVQRYTRHALILYPIVCVFAGAGLVLTTHAIQKGIKYFSKKGNITPFMLWLDQHPAVISTLIGLILVVGSSGRIAASLRYIYRMENYQPVQVQAAETLQTLLQPGDKVGILNLIPWVQADLDRRGISYEWISLEDTEENLAAQGITYVVGTDQFGGAYTNPVGTIWESGAFSSEERIAEFGSDPLQYEGYPAGTLYLLIARIPIN